MSRESSQQRLSVHGGQQASRMDSQTPLGSAAKEQREQEEKPFQRERFFKRKQTSPEGVGTKEVLLWVGGRTHR